MGPSIDPVEKIMFEKEVGRKMHPNNYLLLVILFQQNDTQ